MAARAENVTEGWSKELKFALIFGTPVALGLGYWFYKRQQQGTKMHTFGTCLDEEDETAVGKEKTPLDKAQAAKLRGNKYFKAGQYEQAIKCYTEAIQLCPVQHSNDLSTFYQNRAAAHEQMKNLQNVKEDCTSALQHNKRYVKALNRRAKACEQLGELRQSLEDITAVCILEGFGNQQSLLMADRVLNTLGKSKAKIEFVKREPQLPSTQFIRTYFSSFANDPIMNGLKEPDVVPAGDASQQALVNGQGDTADKEETNKDSPFMRVRKCMARRSYADVIRLCTEEIERDQASGYLAEALLVRATFYLLHGLSDKANADIDRLLEIEPLDVKLRTNALIKRGSLRMQNEQRDLALADFQSAADSDPDNSDIYHHRGQLNLLLDQVDDALRDFERCVTLNPEFPIAQVQKCYSEYRKAFGSRSQMQIEAALASFKKTVAQFPNCADGFALYGQALCDQQLFDDSEENFCKALSIENDNANIYVHRGLLAIQRSQDLEGGSRLIRRAMDIDAKCEFAYETLGTIEVQRGNLTAAIELFDKAVALAKTELEMAHLYSLKEAACAQAQVSKNLGISLPGLMG